MPLLAAIGVFAYGRSQKRGYLGSATGGAVAGAGVFLSQVALVTYPKEKRMEAALSVAVPSVVFPLLLLKE